MYYSISSSPPITERLWVLNTDSKHLFSFCYQRNTELLKYMEKKQNLRGLLYAEYALTLWSHRTTPEEFQESAMLSDQLLNILLKISQPTLSFSLEIFKGEMHGNTLVLKP